jgi:hyperosmotically inducible periplasmic protein
MNSKLVKGVLLAMLCGPVAGYAADAQLKAQAMAFGDSAILSGIKAAYAKDPDLSSADIRVNSTKGAVRLTGAAPDQNIADRAEALANGVKGVVSVQNDIQVSGVGATR